MSVKNIKSKLQAERGFTIIELLIVIVVIGILAAITIVAYTGITARANTNAAKANAQSVQQVVEAYAQANNGDYPNLTSLNAGSEYAKIPTGLTVNSAQLSSSAGTTTIQYVPNSTTGGCIGYWDAVEAEAAYVYAGDADTGANTETPSCS